METNQRSQTQYHNNNPVKKHKNISLFLILVIILAIAIIAMLVYNIATKDNYDNQNKIVHDTVTGEVISGELLEIYNMTETERIKHYFKLYTDALQSNEYEKAYNMLDDKFKNNYFKTLESFKNYVSIKYSPIISVTYDEFTRLGNYYVLDLTFLDLFTSTDGNLIGKKQKFIIHETDYNKYTISFQAE